MTTRAGSLVLTVNGGSSSLKVAAFSLPDLHEVARAELRSDAEDIVGWLVPHRGSLGTGAVAHRFVHGGHRFAGPRRLTEAVLDDLFLLAPLAPNHLPNEIALARALMRSLPDAVHVGCFDTAFHRDLPDVARVLPIPTNGDDDCRRFGFHGLSYAYVQSELERLEGTPAAQGRVVLAHLGSGASVAALKQGRVVDTSMSLTPLGGLVMSTRSGDLDPGVVTYLMRMRQLLASEVDHLLSQQSGLLALSKRSGDMRELLAGEASDANARLAVEVFCYQTSKWIGAMAVALGGLDTLVFTGGVGEHAPSIRERVCRSLSFLNLRINPEANASPSAVISAPDSAVLVRVIPTNEALVMAREARDVLSREPESGSNS